MNKNIKMVGLAIMFIFAIVGIVSITMLIIGFKPTLNPSKNIDWNILGSLATWFNGFVAIAIPITIYILDKRMKERDAKLLKELADFKDEYEHKLEKLATLISSNGDIIIDGNKTKVKNVTAVWG